MDMPGAKTDKTPETSTTCGEVMAASEAHGQERPPTNGGRAGWQARENGLFYARFNLCGDWHCWLSLSGLCRPGQDVIVNNFGEPSETPEHNKLQMRFLDDEFCLKIAQLHDGVTRLVDYAKAVMKNKLKEIERLEADIREGKEEHRKEAEDRKRRKLEWIALHGEAHAEYVAGRRLSQLENIIRVRTHKPVERTGIPKIPRI